MFTRALAATLAATMVMFLSPKLASAGTTAEREAEKRAELATKVKRGIATLGVGPGSRVKIRLHDGSKLAGYVTHVNDTSFDVVDKDGATTTIPYADVAAVKGHNLATGWKVAIGVGVGIAVALIFLVIFYSNGT